MVLPMDTYSPFIYVSVHITSINLSIYIYIYIYIYINYLANIMELRHGVAHGHIQHFHPHVHNRLARGSQYELGLRCRHHRATRSVWVVSVSARVGGLG